jgi:cytochrome c-type biogenesis protein CcmH
VSVVPLRRAGTPVAVLAVILGLGSIPTIVLAADAPVSSRALMIDIEESLVCQCGCGLTVHACNHLNCPSGIPIKKEIAERLARGETKDEIIAYFQTKYGEKVLSAPTLRGFNLVAWVAPFVFVIIGGFVVARVARRWRHETGTHEPPPTPAPVDDAFRERLAREIDEFDG